jgi:hypothetical protein
MGVVRLGIEEQVGQLQSREVFRVWLGMNTSRCGSTPCDFANALQARIGLAWPDSSHSTLLAPRAHRSARARCAD